AAARRPDAAGAGAAAGLRAGLRHGGPDVSGLFAFLLERRHELAGLTAQHVLLVLVSTGAAVALGLPLGVAMTRLPRLARPLLAAAGLVQTIPSLALFAF